MVLYAIIDSVVGILILLFFKNKPKTPPSFTATLKRLIYIINVLEKILNWQLKCYSIILIINSL